MSWNLERRRQTAGRNVGLARKISQADCFVAFVVLSDYRVTDTAKLIPFGALVDDNTGRIWNAVLRPQ